MGLDNFDEILQEADGIILARGNLGIDLPPEKVFLYQKEAIHKCNVAGKPAVVTRVVDSMTDNLRPTRAEATDVANAVLDGSDAILLGAETLRGLYPVETISTVGKICAEAEKAYNQDLYFKKAVNHVGEPMTHLESIASSAVRAAIKVKASIIICFTSSGRAARLIAKYRPTMPVLSVVIPRLKTNQLSWTFSGAFEVFYSTV
ncbi:pyruvate kinase [Salvia divinorum]|uniref:Pyruvate kinase n=1 Tax=Salvia divinorum TaxID=28513 RepID=A0ABD1HAK3_SALDI